MASHNLEERIERLRQLRTSVTDSNCLSVLRRSLQDRANLVVAEAAKTIAVLRASSVIPDLLFAYDLLFEDPIKVDSKCWGKTEIVKALSALDYSESPPFIRGMRHVQMEPVWGGQEDAAAPLRATSILALVSCTDLSRAAVLRHVVDAMADAEEPVRLEAIRALEQLDGEESRLLLRFKARLGDRRPLIVGHVFDALLNLEREPAVIFVGQFLGSTAVEIRDEAALSLGSSKLPEAVKLLIEAWNQTRDREFADVLLRALSSSRQAEAIDFLLNLVRTGMSRDAAIILEAMKLHENSKEIWDLVEQAKKIRASDFPTA